MDPHQLMPWFEAVVEGTLFRTFLIQADDLDEAQTLWEENVYACVSSDDTQFDGGSSIHEVASEVGLANSGLPLVQVIRNALNFATDNEILTVGDANFLGRLAMSDIPNKIVEAINEDPLLARQLGVPHEDGMLRSSSTS